MKQTILQEFEAFAAKVYPTVKPTDAQYREMKLCWFAGAGVMLAQLLELTNESDEEIAAQGIGTLQKEIANEMLHFALRR